MCRGHDDLADAQEGPTLDKLQAGLFLLVTQYTCTPSSALASAIVERLTQLCNHPFIELMPDQKQVFARLLNLWRTRLPLPARTTEHTLRLH